MYALEQFKSRLHEWPQYCSHIIQIPHLKQSHAQLVAEIDQSMMKAKAEAEMSHAAGETPPTSTNPSASPLSLSSNTKMSPTNMAIPAPADPSNHSLGGTATTPPQSPKNPPVFGNNLGKAVSGEGVEKEHTAPPDNILDRVQFIINNISMSNLDQKVSELKEIMPPQYFGWLGNYLVVKRISTQPNFHALYLAFLDKLGDYGKGLVEAILQSVYLNVGKLLR